MRANPRPKQGIFYAAMMATLLFCVAASPVQAGSSADLIRFHGNLALPDEVYFAIIELPETAAADEQTAEAIVAQIESFLGKAGYVMARIDVKVSDKIEITIDEGQVSRVVFRGKGTLKSIQGKSMLDIPHNIFNKPWLERQLRTLEKSLNLIKATYELVPVKKSEEDAIDFETIESLGLLKPLIDFKEKGDYELHIFLDRSANYKRYLLKLGANKEDGLIIRTGYGSQGWFFEDDRLNFYTNLGGANYEPLDGGDKYLKLALLQSGVQWYAPTLLGNVRPLLWFGADMQSRQRFDLDIESYRWLRWRASVNADIKATKTLKIIVGGGIQRRDLTQVVHLSLPSDTLQHSDWGAFFAGNLRWTFSRDLMRLDRDHSLFIEARLIPKAVLNTSWRLRWSWQKWFTYGWSGLLLAAKGTALGGETLFTQDEAVGGKYLRGVFGRMFYVRKVGAGTIEYRFSLKRDIISLGLFLDLAAFEPTQGQVGRQILKQFGSPVVFGGAVGAGTHFLISGMFQLSINFAYGATFSGNPADNQRSKGLALKLMKAF